MKEIYWITRLDALNDWLYTFSTVGIVLGVLTLIAGIIWKYIAFVDADSDVDDDNFKNAKKGFGPLKWTGSILLALGILFGVIGSFTPTTKEACAIYVGGSVVDYVQNNDTLQAIPDKVVNLANEYINKLIQEKEE